jgi:ribosomal-protein-alanine N-acetyltransferase
LRNEDLDLGSWGEKAEVEVLPMEESDLEEILRIEASSFSCPWTAEMFRHELAEAPCSLCLVAKKRMSSLGGRPREVLGYICLWVVGEEMEIANLAVHPSWRRKGIGRTLLSRALGMGSQRQARRAFLEVRASNLAAQRLYRGFGFEVVGVRRGYYRFPPEDAMVMALDLPDPWRAQPCRPKSS